VTRSGSAEDCWPMGSAEDGAFGPEPRAFSGVPVHYEQTVSGLRSAPWLAAEVAVYRCIQSKQSALPVTALPEPMRHSDTALKFIVCECGDRSPEGP